MVSFQKMGELIKTARSFAGIMNDEKISNDADIVKTLFPEIDKLYQAQKELKPLIESLDNYTERVVLSLRYLKGYGYPWIVEKVSMSRASVFNYLKSGKQKLIEKYPDRIMP